MRKTLLASVISIAAVCSFSASVLAWEPNGNSLDAAVQTGDFSGYLARASAWLNEKTPAALNETSLAPLLKDPDFLSVLDQRQLIAKTGAARLAAFAKADAANREFLAGC